MRITRLAILPLLACIATACRDGAAATPLTAPPEQVLLARAVASSGVVTVAAIPAPHGFTSTVLARGSFVDDINVLFRIKRDHATTVAKVDDPSQMVMARVSIIAGGALPWHTHPGPALVTVASGELTVVDSEGCEARRYAAGTSFMDIGHGHVHTAYNAGSAEMVLYVTYLHVPVGQSPLVPAAAPHC